MIEHIFEDMEYIRLFDHIMDNFTCPETDETAYDPDDLATDLHIPRTKVDTILDRFEEMGIVKRHTDDYSIFINSNSLVVKSLMKAELEAISFQHVKK